ncbi:MAG: MarR family winged helix-turn-helix transcriptional regulator [Halocynthiibacter sp.]
MSKIDLLYQIARLARPLHRQVDAAVATMLSNTSITIRMRAVLEALNDLGPSTVPGIARHLVTKRQYVQVMMNEVEHAHLVSREPNPAHKRSVLFKLSSAGKEVISGIRRAELTVLESLARDLTFDEIEKAHHVSEHLLEGYRRLNRELAKG